MIALTSVTYTGPAGVFRFPDFEGEEYVLPKGVPTPVPDKLAERLSDHEHIRVGDEVTPEPETTDTPEPPYLIRLASGPQDGKTGETDSLDPIPGPDDGEYRFADFNEDGEAVFDWHEDPERVNAD